MAWWVPVIAGLGGLAVGSSAGSGAGQFDKGGSLSSAGLDVLTSKKQTITYNTKTDVPINVNAQQYTTTDSRSFQYSYNPQVITNSAGASLSSSPAFTQTPTTSVSPNMQIVPTVIPTQDVLTTTKKAEATGGSWQSILPYVVIGLGAYMIIREK